MHAEVYIRRILVSQNVGVSLRKQRRQYPNIRWDVVFQRGDGWTLAAPFCLESEAYELYKDAWIGFARPNDQVFFPIELCRPRVAAERDDAIRHDLHEIPAKANHRVEVPGTTYYTSSSKRTGTK